MYKLTAENNPSFIYLMINLKIKLITLTLAIQKGYLKAAVHIVLKTLVQYAAKVKKANSIESFRSNTDQNRQHPHSRRAQIHTMVPIF